MSLESCGTQNVTIFRSSDLEISSMSVWHGSLKETKNDKKNHGALVTDDLHMHMDFLQSSWVLRIENS
jgi:hypothetical protein